MTVWVGIITHRHGNNILVHATYDGLRQEVYNYVCENWYELDRESSEAPEDVDEAINSYFYEHPTEWMDEEQVVVGP